MVYTCAYFPTPDADAGRGAGGQDGPRLPQGVAAAGRDGRRGRLRLGLAGPAHGPALRRHGSRRSTSRGSRSATPGSARRPRGWTAASSTSRTTTATSRAASTPSCRWGCWSTSACNHYRELGGVIRRCLKPDGRGLVHSIGRNFPEPTSPWLEKRIFPGSYMPSLSEMMGVFEPCGFSVLDVENLRLHYAKTLRSLAASASRRRPTASRRCSTGGCVRA